MTESSTTLNGPDQKCPTCKSNCGKKIIAIILLLGIGALLGFGGHYLLTSRTSMGGGDPTVASFNGTPIKASEAFGMIKNKISELEQEIYDTKVQAIQSVIEKRLIEAESAKKNISPDQLLEQETASAPKEVTDKDVDEFLKSKGVALDDKRIRKEDVKEYLKYMQKFEKRQQYVQNLKSKAKIDILIPEPKQEKIAVTLDGYPSWGNPQAPVTIAEFSDFQCPYCGRAVSIIDDIKKAYGPDKVRIVFRHLPLPPNQHPRAMAAALASQCAQEQGKFWELHDILFKNQQKLEDSDLSKYASSLKLDMKKYDTCYSSKKYTQLIENSRDEARKFGLDSTPTFVINGIVLRGALPFEKFKEKIDRVIAGH